jgi:hypothetical protein
LSLTGEGWILPDDNFIRFGKNGLLFNNFNITNNQQKLVIHTPKQKIGEEINFEFEKFELSTLSHLIEKDSALFAGTLNGNFQTRNTAAGSAFVADLKITSFAYREIPVGDIDLHADNNTADLFNASLNLKGNENDVVIKAVYKPKETLIDMNVDLSSLNMNTVAAFSNGQITESAGQIKGNIKVNGNTSHPQIDGKLNFVNASFHSTYANNHFTLKNESLTFDSKGIYLDNFTLLDSASNPAVFSGNVLLENFSVSRFDLEMNLNNFTALNTGENDNKLFYGKLILNSKTKITGTQLLPKIYSRTKLVEGSTITIVAPESKVSTDVGEGVVIFTDSSDKINPILKRESTEEQSASDIKGIDLYTDLEIDKNSTLKILVDPYSGDSLVLKGDATLSFGIDPSGKTSLTGTYTVSEGSYRVSLEEIVKKDFSIKNGSTIFWNGEPMDATINIEAIHEEKTSPIDLVAGQIEGLSEQERNTYKQELTFLVILKMTGQLLKPNISFTIDMKPNDRGAMGGTVYAKLNQLNNDPSELNKQVFALLVLGRFVQEDPLASAAGGGGLSSVARTSVSKLLSQQLNKFSNRFIKAVELNFDLQSYDDFSTGTAEERTELAIGLKKQIFNERLSVAVGSKVDLSEKNARGNTNELASDVTLEYKLTSDGIYRLKAFRQNQFEDVIEGPLNVTGVGLIYTRDFDRWQNLFKPSVDEEFDNIPLKSD